MGSWGSMQPFCHFPNLAGPKIHPQFEKGRYVRLQLENRFNIQGVSSLAGYMDRPAKKEIMTESIAQRTMPISIQFVLDNKRKHPNPFNRSLKSDYFVPHIKILSFENVPLGIVVNRNVGLIMNSCSTIDGSRPVDVRSPIVSIMVW